MSTSPPPPAGREPGDAPHPAPGAPALSFESAWTNFQRTESLLLSSDTLEAQWTQGRAQYLTLLVRIEDRAAAGHLARVVERIAGIPGVEPYPDWYWHITVKGIGFQVIKRSQPDDVLRQDVARIAGKARALFGAEPAFQAQLGPVNAFAEVVFVEIQDEGRVTELNCKLLEALPEAARYPPDGPGFLPHVSVARFSSNDGLAQLKETLAALRAEGPGPRFNVGRVELIKAWLSEDVPELDTLASYLLRPAR